MIILRESRPSIREGITNYDKAVASSTSQAVVNALQAQYKNNIETAGSMMTAERFGYAQTYGALSGVLTNLDILNAATPTRALKSLIANLQVIKKDMQKALSSLD
jgi:hypothetical protein